MIPVTENSIRRLRQEANELLRTSGFRETSAFLAGLADGICSLIKSLKDAKQYASTPPYYNKESLSSVLRRYSKAMLERSEDGDLHARLIDDAAEEIEKLRYFIQKISIEKGQEAPSYRWDQLGVGETTQGGDVKMNLIHSNRDPNDPNSNALLQIAPVGYTIHPNCRDKFYRWRATAGNDPMNDEHMSSGVWEELPHGAITKHGDIRCQRSVTPNNLNLGACRVSSWCFTGEGEYVWKVGDVNYYRWHPKTEEDKSPGVAIGKATESVKAGELVTVKELTSDQQVASQPQPESPPEYNPSPHPPIPEGWYAIGPDEVIAEGDKHSIYEQDWYACTSSIGSTPRRFGTLGKSQATVIRKKPMRWRACKTLSEFEPFWGTTVRRKDDYNSQTKVDAITPHLTFYWYHRNYETLDGKPIGVEEVVEPETTEPKK